MYSHGFLKVAATSPRVRAGDPFFNVEEMLKVVSAVKNKIPGIICFPEMGVPGYSLGDLVYQKYLYDDSIKAIEYFLQNNDYPGLVIFGSFLVIDEGIYNCAFVAQRDRILGIVPKNSTFNENYQSKCFTSGSFIASKIKKINLFKEEIPFGNIIFESDNGEVTFGVAIGIDGYSDEILLANGALLLFNLKASSLIIGKDEFRDNFARTMSHQFMGAYIEVSNNASDSSSEVVFSGHKLICENGELLAESKEVTLAESIIYGDIDIFKLHYFRRKNKYCRRSKTLEVTKVPFSLIETKDFIFEKNIDIYPFVPKKIADYQEIIDLQAAAVMKRLDYVGIKKVVIGVSGGLDSTLALLSLCYAFDKYGLDRNNILAYTLPASATSNRTLTNSLELMKRLGVSLAKIPISQAVNEQLNMIGHDENCHDITYENAHARYRTLTLMNLANQNQALVIGTSDMSEIALGWSTFNGDHMAMYGINAGLPKTVVSKVVAYYKKIYPMVTEVLDDIVDTPISPELASSNQKTEELIGKYEINDFILYHFLVNGDDDERIIYLLEKFISLGHKEALDYVNNFNKRFFSQQYKRLTTPESPKILDISLSSRTEISLNGDIYRLNKND